MDSNGSLNKEPPTQEWRHGYPLITPSASPPASRSYLLADRLSRASTTTGTATPTPTRRNRTATPAGSHDSTFDLHLARTASAMRAWEVWQQLEEKYTRSIDQDDIIDLRTNSVVKDRGILRGFSQQFDIGTFAEADVNDAASEGVGGQTEGEDDVDEIDAFAPEADLEVQAFNLSVPPARELDPEDLKEFLEAEQRRKELYGEGEEDEEEDADEVAYVGSKARDNIDGRTDDAPPIEENNRHHSAGEDSDELGNWEEDESTALYFVEPGDHPDADDDNAPDAPSSPTISPSEARQPETRLQLEVVLPSRPSRKTVTVSDDGVTPCIPASAKGKGKAIPSPRARSLSPSPGPSQSRAPDLSDAQNSPNDVHPDTPHTRKTRAKAKAKGKKLRIPSTSLSEDDSPPRIPASAKGKGKALPPSGARSATPAPSATMSKPVKSSLRQRHKTKSRDPSEAETAQDPEVNTPVAKGRKRKRVSDESMVPSEDRVSFTRLASSPSPSPVPYCGSNASSAEASGEESDARPKSPIKSRSLSRSRAASKLRGRSRHRSQPPPQQGPGLEEAQRLLADAMRHLSYLISSTVPGNRENTAPPPPWIPPHNFLPQGSWPPQTPSHRHRSAGPSHAQSSSSPARPSSAFATPTHSYHPYPHSYDPTYSSATLPPSSPPLGPSSPISSPDFEKMRPCRRSEDRGRSQSKGKRVSFKLDSPPSRTKRKTKKDRGGEKDDDDSE